MAKHQWAVILAGGRGERFWPLSTAARPKQFISLFGGRPLLALALERLRHVVPPERTLIITSAALCEATIAAARGLPAANVIGEPCARDTAAACALACGCVAARDPEGVVAILTADHIITDVETFRQTLRDSFAVAVAGDHIVTIGIAPTFPATGYGYIAAGEPLPFAGATRFNRAERFVEKPDEATARRYIESGSYCWNAGMFIWRADTMRAAIENHAPELLAILAVTAGAATGGDLGARLAPVYEGLHRISVDYAIMERARNIVMARGAFGWDDVGAWPAISGHFAPDASGNVAIGLCESLDATGNLVVSEERLTALIGVRDLVVIHSGNATLICPRARAQEVKQLVQRLARRPDGEKYL